jgi:hypothetical protein
LGVNDRDAKMPTGFTSLELSKVFLSCTLINAGGFHFRGTGTGTDTDLEIVETMDGFKMLDFISGSFAMGLFISCETFGTLGLDIFILVTIVYGLESCRLLS